ncbi:hypothetical protein RHMOL_Rhmol12G0108200 [Rhododendron molle]|uniref:Uncharacterized protein n=1 Tax=Rhododendron molle TaxID=49168 RepID=A0ACC0LI82_RHOML|nr:hypothetical protein RHMOL_Rhmol12G0108200 [Rhododendron molle]
MRVTEQLKRWRQRRRSPTSGWWSRVGRRTASRYRLTKLSLLKSSPETEGKRRGRNSNSVVLLR